MSIISLASLQTLKKCCRQSISEDFGFDPAEWFIPHNPYRVTFLSVSPISPIFTPDSEFVACDMNPGTERNIRRVADM
jgi:hypothetical protein